MSKKTPLSEVLEIGEPVTQEMVKELARLESCERALLKLVDYGFDCDSDFAIKLNRVQQRWTPGMTQEERDNIGL